MKNVYVGKCGEVVYKKDFSLDNEFLTFVKLLSLKDKVEIAITLFEFRLSIIRDNLFEDIDQKYFDRYYTTDIEKLYPRDLKQDLENFDFGNSRINIFISYISNYVYIRMLTFFKKLISKDKENDVYTDIYSAVKESFDLFTMR